MKRLSVLLLLAALPTIASGQAAIELDYFPGGEIVLSSDYPIYWMWNPGNLAVPPTHFNLEMYRGGVEHSEDNGQFIGIIAANLPLGNPGINQTGGGSADNGGIFHWTAGKLVSGMAPPGANYCVRAVTTDGQIASYCYHFDLVESQRRMIPAMRLRDVALARDPGCPMCGIFDVRELLARLGVPAGLQGDLVLMRDGRRVAALGRLGPAGLAPGQKVTVRFTPSDIPLVRDGSAGFEAVIIGAAGNRLFARPIRLKFPR